MVKKVLMGVVCWLGVVGISHAQSWEFDLNAGSHSATGGVHYRQYIDTGYMKLGATGVYSSEDHESYRLGSLDFVVGTDTWSPGLTCEVGLRGILGNAEENNRKGDIGGVGFTGYVEYLFPKSFIPVPVEAFTNLTYAPDSLSFGNNKNYVEFGVGAGIRIGRSASIRLVYTTYNIEMDNASPNWTANDDSIRMGLIMRF